VRGPRQGPQARRRDGFATAQAGAVGSVIESRQRRIDESQLLGRPVPKREVALLREDLAGGRSL
jgi:hypothetical protein